MSCPQVPPPPGGCLKCQQYHERLNACHLKNLGYALAPEFRGTLPNGQINFACLPWWRRDKHGWPIERVMGRHWFWYGVRIVIQNLRKIRLLRRGR